MNRSMLTLLLGGVLAATAPAAPAAAQDDRGMEQRQSEEAWRAQDQWWGRERRWRDPSREAYERGYRQGRLDEQREGYATRRPYAWSGEERFEREGRFGGLFGEREYERED